MQINDNDCQALLPHGPGEVDYWLDKWGRNNVVRELEPMTLEDVERLVQVNDGVAANLCLAGRNLQGVEPEGSESPACKSERSQFRVREFRRLQSARSQFRSSPVEPSYIGSSRSNWGRLERGSTGRSKVVSNQSQVGPSRQSVAYWCGPTGSNHRVHQTGAR